MLPLLLTFFVIVAAGGLLLAFGPVGWRTHIMGAVVGVCPILGEILDQLGAFDWSRLLDGKVAVGAGLAVGLLIIIFNAVNKKLYGSSPKAAG